MIARTAVRVLLLRLVALTALLAVELLAGGAASPLAARAIAGPVAGEPDVHGAVVAVGHAARGRCPALPASPFGRESAEGRDDTPAPGCDPVRPRADALPRRPTRVLTPAGAPESAAPLLHRAHAGSESCSGTSLPPPRA